MKNFFTIVVCASLLFAFSTSFGQWPKYTIDSYLYSATIVDVADINCDGNLDVAATGWEADKVVWYENNSPDTAWTKHTIDANLDGAVGVYIADIDGDDTLDVVATGMNADRVVWYKNGNAGQTWTEYTIDANLDGAWELCIGDIDGDDTRDVVATGRYADDIVWYQNGAGTPINWTKNTIDANLDWPSAVDVADIDLDSDLDVFVTVYDADRVVWYENGGGTPINWIKHTIDANMDGAAFIHVAYINNDTYPDAVVTGQNANKVVWYKNPGHTSIE